MSVPPLVVCATAVALYALGGRGRRGSTSWVRRSREISFYLGMLIVLVALEPPFDTLADTSFAMHMAQHVLLLSFAPPLLVLGRPWPRMWMPFPSGPRRAVARGIAQGRSTAPLRLAARTVSRPPVALAVMAATMGVWHFPSMYGAAVDHVGIHLLEHLSFLATALLFFGPLLEAPPIRARVDHFQRAVWFGLGAVPGWILAIVLAESPRSMYSVYASLPHRAFGLSAYADQQIAAGVMWVPGGLTFVIGFIYFIYRWLEPGETLAREPRTEELSWT